MTEAFTNSDIQYPPGTIIMWDSHPDQIPHGWVFCDGNNGTQDMRNKILMSVPDGTTDPGSTVGADSYGLSKAQLPTHNHSGSTDSVGDHNHGSIAQTGGSSDSDSTGDTDGREPEGNHATPAGSYNTVSSGSHSHSISPGSTGSGNSIDNRPKEQTVNFIQKT